MDEKILLSHGAGGRQAETLIREEIIRPLQNQWLMRREDSAVMDFNGKMAFTTDSHVVSPLFFPGGDIGRLSVCGTVNDLAMAGAQPLFLSLGLIMEEGLSLSVLRDVIASIRKTAETAGVAVVTGDTKVVPRGQADQLYINTAGVGKIPEGVNLSATAIQPGDCLVINGTVGDHGLALLSCREELAFSTTLKSDCAPLHDLTATMLKAVPAIRCLRDPTRGGLATTINEWADQSGCAIRLWEKSLPMRPEVLAAAEMLGLDPLYSANEGKLVAAVPEEEVDRVLSVMRDHPLGKDAAVIGQAENGRAGRVVMTTILGTSRMVEMPAGNPYPRIC
jgi:hydrogenase expression/formation protein HypE